MSTEMRIKDGELVEWTSPAENRLAGYVAGVRPDCYRVVNRYDAAEVAFPTRATVDAANPEAERVPLHPEQSQ